ncbi:MAG: hypothetical protein OEL68_05480, partial [Desulfobulbaceae bacterium]|nr:hypothetical protein [Desulfobulbaceae bacterium]
MDNYRAILAIVLAFFILLGYQYLFVAPEQEQRQPVVETTAEQAPQPRISPQVVQPTPAPAEIVQAEQTAQFEEPVNLPAQKGRDIVVETSKYIAVISETGGGMK